MENMWKRETVQPHASYVDLFASIPDDLVFQMQLKLAKSAIRYKDNVVSAAEIDAGDNYFDNGNYFGAMNKYTLSLCFAEIGSQNIAVAYQRRANCCYIAKMYRETLTDFRLSREGALSDHFLRRTEKLERDLRLTMMNTVPQESEKEPTLCYPVNTHFPGLANVVNVNYDRQFGRHLVTDSDIPQGKTILLGQNFAGSYIFQDDTIRCYTCFREKRNFIPCEHCVYVVFCDSECRNRNRTHAFECGTFFGILEKFGDAARQFEWLKIKLVVQTLLNALVTFCSVEKMMEFVENTFREDLNQLPTSMHDATSNYRFFFKLNRFVDDRDSVHAKRAYRLAMELPKITIFFNTREKQLFLMHLIAHHTSIIYSNCTESKNTVVINNLNSLFNHSCEPNTSVNVVGNSICAETVRPVEKGEQLFVSYLSFDDKKQSRTYRQCKLLSLWRFNCKCNKCESK